MAIVVSVIIPVYNVFDYLDECLESVVKQTFSDIEIILITGFSNDGSDEKALAWTKKDDRIKFYEATSKELGGRRNQGVKVANGEYVYFVDSDDYIVPDCIEKLYNAIVEKNADIAECDFSQMRTYLNEKEMEYVSSASVLKRPFNMLERLQMGYVITCKLMIKRDFILQHQIYQPNLPAEDLWYIFYVLYESKIVNVNQSLYIYRKSRPGNLSSDMVIRLREHETYELLLSELSERGLMDKYYIEIGYYIRRWLSRGLSRMFSEATEAISKENREKRLEIYYKYFSEKMAKEFLLGSYNLTKIVQKLPLLEDPLCRFNFSSMIAIMDKRKEKYQIEHKNKYRKKMMERELNNDFFRLIKEEKPDFFFFDLIEERHDIVEFDESFLTKSDAFAQSNLNAKNLGKTISRTSEECSKLWQNCCVNFFERLFDYIEPNHIFMIENYLCEQHGDGENITYYENIEEIREINKVLKSYYSFIKHNYQEVIVIQAYNVSEYYTDNHYEYGCYPWHINEWANISIAKLIEKNINRISLTKISC